MAKRSPQPDPPEAAPAESVVGNGPFIASQGMSLLAPTVRNVKAALQTLVTSAGPPSRDGDRGAAPKSPQNEHWQQFSRRELIDQLLAQKGARVGLVIEAGIGKSANLERIEYLLAQPESTLLAVRFDVDKLPKRLADVLTTLAELICERLGDHVSRTQARAVLARALRLGRLVLLIDALDQATNEDALKTLAALVDRRSADWKPCRVVLAGRPYSFDYHWAALFRSEAAPDWRFVKLEEFTELQQRAYLTDAIYNQIPHEARDILSVPRVLHYLRQLKAEDLQQVHTPSHVYWFATQRMLRHGLEARHAVRLDAADAWLLLSAIAIEMYVVDADYEQVPPDQIVRFRAQVARRCSSVRGRTSSDWVTKKLKQLAAMNTITSHGFLERGCPEQIQYRNKSLRHFFAALWLARYGEKENVKELWERLYIPHLPATHKHYWLWRYAVEMPADRDGRHPEHDARNAAVWVRNMAPLFKPGDGTAAGTKRSCEMIYRAWKPMEEYAAVPATGARQVLEGFLGEFESLRRGKKSARQQTAQQFVDRFITIEGGWFQMGSDPKGGWTQVESFQLNEFPTLNSWYRLFDPGHGGASREYPWRKYAEVSPLPESPAIYVSWYDAWVSCQWARWGGRSCRLPEEQEFEYAAKGCRHKKQGQRNCKQCLQNYWWGVDFKAEHCTANQDWETGSTSPLPVALRRETIHPHRNPFDLVDILGNVWEWCSDWWTDPYVRGGDLRTSARVIRGGSWYLLPWGSRSAFRSGSSPSDSNGGMGFRVARAVPEKL